MYGCMDPFRGNKDPDSSPRKKYFFLLITQKIIYYNIDIENINSNEKNSYDFFHVFKVKKLSNFCYIL